MLRKLGKLSKPLTHPQPPLLKPWKKQTLTLDTSSRKLVVTPLNHPVCVLKPHHAPSSPPPSLTRSHAHIVRAAPQDATSSFTDPFRPDLFYHLIHPPTPVSQGTPVFGLSFLPFSPTHADSSTILGWLPAQVHDTDEDAEREVINGDIGLRGSIDTRHGNIGQDLDRLPTLADFKENQNFMKLLHNTIKTCLQTDQIQMNGAKQAINGWMHIHDQRSVPVWGPIGDPEDIIASVLVQDSNIVPDTYQPVPSYRLFTQDGMMQLTPGLRNKLHEALLRIAELEKSISIQSEAVHLDSANQVRVSEPATPSLST